MVTLTGLKKRNKNMTRSHYYRVLFRKDPSFKIEKSVLKKTKNHVPFANEVRSGHFDRIEKTKQKHDEKPLLSRFISKRSQFQY